MKINALSTTLEELFSGLDVKYSVPKYQRDYSWTSSVELKELWTDIISSFREKKEYFMGTLLLAKQTDDKKYYDIVDGQQRIVSFMLLLAVIHDYSKLVLENNPIVTNLTVTNGGRDTIADDMYQLVKNRIKQRDYYLKVANKDAKSFMEALDIQNRNVKIEISNRTNRILKAKAFFQDKIRSEFFGTTDSLLNLNSFLEFIITKLMFVKITVEDDLDAYVIFESLNSKGLDLSVSDLLKNKMLSNISQDYQDSALLEWDELVKKIQTTSSSFVDYIKFFWSAYYNPDVTKANLYKDIKKHIGNNESATKKLLDELTKNADTFCKIKNKTDSNWPKITSKESWAETIAEMNLLGYTIHLPCFLYALHNNEAIFERLSKLSVTLLFKWVTICDNGIGDIDSLFKSVLKSLKDNEGILNIESKFEALFDKVDPVFQEKFASFETENTTILKYITCKHHLFNNGKYQIPNYLEVDLEHVLPKSLDEWKSLDNFSSLFSEPYSRWINNIGNVILLEKGKNRKIQNSIFSKKSTVYTSSEFESALEISNLLEWNESSIKERGKKISNDAVSIWGLKR